MTDAASKWTIVCLALVVAATACGDDGGVAPVETVELPSATAERIREEEEVDPILGADGELLESDVIIAGLTLPRGLEEGRQTERDHIYYANGIPMIKVLRYFGTRLLTGQVDEIGDGAIYRRARVRDAVGPVVWLDVSILGAGRDRIRVHVHEIPRAPVQPMSDSEIRRRVAEDFARLD